MYVLSLQPKHAIAGVSLSLPQRSGVNTREFLVFNQELATLLKAGMPLVQSLDLLKRRVTSPVFKRVLDDVHEKVRSGTALSDAFAAHGDLFPACLHGLAARRRAQRQPRRGAAPIRRVHEDHRDGQTQDGLRAGLSGDSHRPRHRARRHHRAEGRAGLCRLLQQLRRRFAAGRRGSSSASRRSCAVSSC